MPFSCSWWYVVLRDGKKISWSHILGAAGIIILHDDSEWFSCTELVKTLLDLNSVQLIWCLTKLLRAGSHQQINQNKLTDPMRLPGVRRWIYGGDILVAFGGMIMSIDIEDVRLIFILFAVGQKRKILYHGVKEMLLFLWYNCRCSLWENKILVVSIPTVFRVYVFNGFWIMPKADQLAINFFVIVFCRADSW